MKIDENQQDAAQAMREGDRRNRREFFNGLGKWSMIVVAAVSLLRGSGSRARADHGETPRSEPEAKRPAWTVPEDRGERMQVAKKPYVKGGGHTNYHLDMPSHQNERHLNHKIVQ